MPTQPQWTPRTRRPLMAFVMVLSWSRQIYLRFFLDARMDSFLAGHAGAFETWSGLPRVLLYDNLKSAVLERHGDAIRFNPQLLAFAAHLLRRRSGAQAQPRIDLVARSPRSPCAKPSNANGQVCWVCPRIPMRVNCNWRSRLLPRSLT